MPVLPLMHPTRRLLGSSQSTGEMLGRSATGYWDAFFHDGSQTLRNLGVGGSGLDITLGSSVSPDSNDPTWCPWTTATYVYGPGATEYCSMPDSVVTSVTGDIDVTVRCTPDAVAAVTYTLTAKTLNTGNQRSWAFEISSGVLGFGVSLLGLDPLTTDNVSPSTLASAGFVLGQTCWLRIYRIAATGVTSFFYHADQETEPALASYTSLGTSTKISGAMFDSSNGITCFGINNGSARPYAGRIYRVIVRSGVDGAPVADINFDVITSSGATSFIEQANGATVTINRPTSGKKAAIVATQPILLFGTDDYGETPDNPLLDFAATDDFTIGVCLREWATPVSNRVLMGKRSSSGAGWTLRGEGTTYAGVGVITDGTNNANGTSPAAASGVRASYVSTINRGTQRIITYAQGVAGSSADLTTVGSLVNSIPLDIMRRPTVGTDYADGEGFCWFVDRRVWSPQEITVWDTYVRNRRQ